MWQGSFSGVPPFKIGDVFMCDDYEALKLKNQICFPLYACSREIIKKYRPFLDEINLTYTQYIAMMILWESKKISIKDMGKKLFLDSGTLTPVLKSLENKGFITRYRSREDERVLIAEITQEGENLKEKALHIPEKIGNCSKLTAEEAQFLHKILYKMLGE